MVACRLNGAPARVAIEQVLYVQGAGDYAELHCAGAQTHLHDKSLNTLEHLLCSRFIRSHRSYLVNLGAIAGLRCEPGSRYWLKLSSGQEIPVSRSRVGQLRLLMI